MRIIAYQIGSAIFSMHAKNNEWQKEAAHPQGSEREIAGPFTRMSCVRAHWPRPARRGERARVVLPFPLPNDFNKIEIAQLFKLASLLLK
jgi:hypothetical protein